MEAPTAAENSRTSLDEDLSTSAFDHLAKSDKLQALAKDRAQADAAWEEHSKVIESGQQFVDAKLLGRCRK